jgi:hypothetical protein
MCECRLPPNREGSRRVKSNWSRGLAEGLTNEAIAHRHGVSEHTVKLQLGKLSAKVDVKGRLALVLWAPKALNARGGGTHVRRCRYLPAIAGHYLPPLP